MSRRSTAENLAHSLRTATFVAGHWQSSSTQHAFDVVDLESLDVGKPGIEGHHCPSAMPDDDASECARYQEGRLARSVEVLTAAQSGAQPEPALVPA